MAMFEYSSLTESGRLMRGTIEASDAQQARQMLAEMKLDVQELSKVETKQPAKGVGANEFLLFNQQLESITRASIPLEKGLRAIARDAATPKMRRLLSDIAARLEAGVPIEQAFAEHQKHFPPLYGMMLRAGIRTGRLGEMLTCLNRHLEIVRRTRQIIIESVSYPLVALFLAAAIATGIFVFIMPTYTNVLLDMSEGKADLPWLTRTVMAMSEKVGYFWAGAAILIGFIIFVWTALSGSSAGRRAKESFIMKIPLLGRIYKAGILARFSEAMGLLVDSGCTLPESLRLAAASAGSEKVIYDATLLAEHIEKGFSVIDAGAVCRTLPSLMLYSIQLGGQRNCLKENLYEMGRMYAQQTFGMQARLQTILMPVAIIGIGLMVGTMVAAMFLPMVRMIQVMM